MIRCEICNGKIYENSQFIDGKYFHNKCIKDLSKEIREKDKEILEMKHRINDLIKDNTEYKLENLRLNNIINELEKYIDDNYFYDDVGMKIFDVSLLEDKLNELKERDNNE